MYSHTAAKLFFVRLFRGSRHIHQHTYQGWSTWAILILFVNGAAFTLAIGIPIFSYIVSIAASLFASWYTYGIVGVFWLYDAYYGLGRGKINGVYGVKAWMGSPVGLAVNILTFLAGLFICVAGTSSALSSWPLLLHLRFFFKGEPLLTARLQEPMSLSSLSSRHIIAAILANLSHVRQ